MSRKDVTISFDFKWICQIHKDDTNGLVIYIAYVYIYSKKLTTLIKPNESQG